MSNAIVPTNTNSNEIGLWDEVKHDFADMGDDAVRLTKATVKCGTKSASLTMRVTVVTVETVNAGLDVALEVMPKSAEETKQLLLDAIANSDNTNK